jgi:hypothetical protein
MSQIIIPEIAARIFAAMEDVALSNNGYTQMPAQRRDVVRALELAGYVVRANPNGIFGANGVMVFSAAAWAIFVEEQNAILRPLAFPQVVFDAEAAILSRNADYLLA